MTKPALQIGYHDHCFDGVASSAVFLRFYREKIRALDDAQLGFKGFAHKAGAPFDASSFSGEENVIVDFRYAIDPRLTWWFDHHQSAFETKEAEADFRADTSGRKFWDPAAKSCTKFIARVCAEKFGFERAPMAELIDWAEIIDGALFPNAQMAVELVEPAMQLMLLIEASKDAELGPKLIRELSHRPLSAVLREEWITQPLQPLLERHHKIVAQVGERLEVKERVATFDVADLDLDNINKFIAYAKNPDALYTVSVTRSASRSKISLGSNPWKQSERRHNLAQMAERYKGGGHPAVAAISFPPDQLDQAREVAKQLADELRR